MLFSWKPKEDVLDTGADLGARAVIRLLLVSERLVALTFLANMTLITGVLQDCRRILTAISAVGPHLRVQVIGIDEGVKHPAVMHMRRGRLEAADDFMLRVDTDVILVAERVFAALSRPTPIHTFLRPFRPHARLGEAHPP